MPLPPIPLGEEKLAQTSPSGMGGHGQNLKLEVSLPTLYLAIK